MIKKVMPRAAIMSPVSYTKIVSLGSQKPLAISRSLYSTQCLEDDNGTELKNSKDENDNGELVRLEVQ